MIAASSAGVIIHPQVNRTSRHGENIDSRRLTRLWLAPARPRGPGPWPGTGTVLADGLDVGYFDRRLTPNEKPAV